MMMGLRRQLAPTKIGPDCRNSYKGETEESAMSQRLCHGEHMSGPGDASHPLEDSLHIVRIRLCVRFAPVRLRPSIMHEDNEVSPRALGFHV